MATALNATEGADFTVEVVQPDQRQPLPPAGLKRNHSSDGVLADFPAAAAPGGRTIFAGPLATNDHEAIALFRQALETNHFTETGLGEALGPDMSPHLKRADLPLYQRRLSAEGPLNTLIKLFSLQLAVSESAARAALAPLALEQAMALGLIQAAQGEIRGRLALSLCEGLWLASDCLPESASRLTPDHVLGTNPAAATLAKLTVRRPVRRALDVGTGCGVQALLAARHSEWVIAVDTNPRALNYTQFNAELNALNRVECRLGSLFEPVHDCEFDLVVCNPPFVISPDSEFLFRDSGMPGDRLSEVVVRAVPAHLAEGGFASILCSWAHEQEEEWSAHIGPWVADSGCDAWLLHGVTRDPLGYAASWNRGPDAIAYGQCLDRWQEYYQRLGIQALSVGAVVLRRRSCRQNWVRLDDLPPTFTESCSEHILRITRAEDYLAANPDSEQCFSETFRLAEDLQVQQTFGARADKLILEQIEVRLTGGLRLHGLLGPSAVQLLARCDGHRSMEQIIRELAEAEGRPVAEIKQQVGPLLRQLISCGFLIPAAAEAAFGPSPLDGGAVAGARTTHAPAPAAGSTKEVENE